MPVAQLYRIALENVVEAALSNRRPPVQLPQGARLE